MWTVAGKRRRARGGFFHAWTTFVERKATLLYLYNFFVVIILWTLARDRSQNRALSFPWTPFHAAAPRVCARSSDLLAEPSRGARDSPRLFSVINKKKQCAAHLIRMQMRPAKGMCVHADVLLEHRLSSLWLREPRRSFEIKRHFVNISPM